MPFTVSVELLRGVYDAGSAEERSGDEWPPSPARLVCALLAVAEHDTHDRHLAALRWLESQPAPSIQASLDVHRGIRRESYVPLNEIEAKGTSYHRFPARKAGSLQAWSHVVPRVPTVRMIWPSAPDAEVLDALMELVGEVAYLGRSTCPVELSVTVSPDSVTERASESGMSTLVAGGMQSTRVVTLPQPGYIDELCVAFEEGRPAHDVVRRGLRFGVEQPTSVQPASSPYDSGLLILPFADRRRINATFVMPVSSAVRKAMESVVDGGPVTLRGSRPGEDGPRHQLLILGLPDVGHEHASGMMGGVAIALPTDLDGADRKLIYSAIADVAEQGVTAGRLGILRFDSSPSTLQMLSPERWCRASTTWVSATPVTLDRSVDVRRSERVEQEIRRSCGHADIPPPTRIEWSASPLIDGAPTVPPHRRVRRKGDRVRPSLHVRLTFERPVSGPIALGNLRRYGLGLLAPTRAASLHE